MAAMPSSTRTAVPAAQGRRSWPGRVPPASAPSDLGGGFIFTPPCHIVVSAIPHIEQTGCMKITSPPMANPTAGGQHIERLRRVRAEQDYGAAHVGVYVLERDEHLPARAGRAGNGRYAPFCFRYETAIKNRFAKGKAKTAENTSG